jgi:hypothetical protein
VAATTLSPDRDHRLDASTSLHNNPHHATSHHGFLADLCARAGDPHDYAQWRRQVRAAGYCQRPVRLVGGVNHVDPATGEARTVFDTAGEPDGLLLKACGTRRAARCPPCAEVYRADAYQLLKVGLAGGKGVPETVAGHPRLFVTFTAPSFGPVHSSRVRRGRVQRCRPARAGARCRHGRHRRCGQRHLAGDPALGTPICPDCYDYARAVVWNALAPQLWKRTTIYLRRVLARQAGLIAVEAGREVRLAYAKVAEYQQRGTIHLHVIIRLDGPDPQTPPPAWASVDLLAAALRQTAAQVSLVCPLGGPPIRWGDQLDLRPIHLGAGERSERQVAGYLAKYATKATRAWAPPSTSPSGAWPSSSAWPCPSMSAASCEPVGASAASHPPPPSGYAAGRTCSATAATASPRASTTRPPFERCVLPAGHMSPAAATAPPWPSITTAASCLPTAWSSWRAGSTPAAATPPPQTPGWPPPWPPTTTKPASSPARS